MFVRINGEETRYKESLQTFTTQHGHEAIRFVGDPIPETNKGFKAYDSNDREVADLSKYTYPYGPNEYTTVADELEPVEPGTSKPLPESPLDVRLDQMNDHINKLSPKVSIKEAYIGDTESEFYYQPGNIDAWIETRAGQIPCSYEVTDDKIIVKFDALEEVAKVYVSIQ